MEYLVKKASRKRDTWWNSGQHESRIMKIGKFDFAVIDGEMLTIHMDGSGKNAAKKR